MPTFIYNKAAERFRAEYNAWFAQYMHALEESFTPEEREQVDAAIARVRAAQQEIEELLQAFERGREDDPV